MELGCIQHCKRKFIEIETQTKAKDIIDTYNEFYHLRKTSSKEKWVAESLKVYDKLESKLRKIEQDKKSVCNSILSKAVAYSLNELDSIRNIILSTDYDLDNNKIERPMHYISISRKNSMFCGYLKGAERMALIYSCHIMQVKQHKHKHILILLRYYKSNSTIEANSINRKIQRIAS